MANYDLLIMPSHHEGFGLSALEAILAEISVIVSEEAGIAEHVSKAKCGFLVAPKVDHIVMKIMEALARKSEWYRMEKNGRSYALDNLTWEKIAQKGSCIYEKIIEDRGR